MARLTLEENERYVSDVIANELTRLRAALAAAEMERAALRDALVRWIESDETPDFMDADEALAVLARSLLPAREAK